LVPAKVAIRTFGFLYFDHYPDSIPEKLFSLGIFGDWQGPGTQFSLPDSGFRNFAMTMIMHTERLPLLCVSPRLHGVLMTGRLSTNERLRTSHVEKKCFLEFGSLILANLIP
jgi:hypothetical protein